MMSESDCMVSVQIFGLKDSQATRAAERFFKERRVAIQFVDLKQKDVIGSRLSTHPYGLVSEVLARGATPPSLERVLADNQALYAGFELGYPPPGPDDEYATVIHRRYAATWKMLGRALERAGRRDDAAAAYAAAERIGPRE